MTEIDELVKAYNTVNNSFNKKCIYHLGIDAGFHSEIDAMMECMIYCYLHKIKFVVYSDDSNIAGGRNCYEEFFEPFCEMSHNRLNHFGNFRYDATFDYGKKYRLCNWLIRRIEKADYLTSDIFSKCIPREYACNTQVEWDLFGIKGTIFDEFAKVSRIAMRYNNITNVSVENYKRSLNLPKQYLSVQLRGGDKLLEVAELNNIDDVMEVINSNNNGCLDLLVFTDDYYYVEEIEKRYSQYNVYTLTQKYEDGYVNDCFNRKSFSEKKEQMYRLFASIDMCIDSEIHFGNEQSCANNYIRSMRIANSKEYYCIVK